MIPVILKDISPCASLEEYVVKYQVFRFIFDREVLPPVKFHAPRPEHCITFYLRDTQRFSYINTQSILVYPQCVINGMYTVPILRFGGNDFWAIKVVLQPSTLYHLINIPLPELTNKFINAEEVWGNEIRLVCEQLNSLNDLDIMIMVIETFLISLIKKIKKITLPIDKVTHYLLQAENRVNIDWLANQSCFSIRQFIRNFEERIGISAKKFERIIRFDKVYRMKNSHPDHDWLYIAIACGYHDYQHMVKDFKEFTNLTPPSFYELEKKSPERCFGFYES
jgi:AraC-like DNA-binding protein